MTQPAEISVIVPAYNAAGHIEKALDSVLAQTLIPHEIIVVDDGSSDDTSRILDSYGKRIRSIHQSNTGQSSARNVGIQVAKGEWIAFLDTDDYWLPTKLERQAAMLADKPSIGFCSTSTRAESPEGEMLDLWCCPRIRDDILHTIFVNNAAVAGSCSAVVARRKLLLQAGLFDENLHGLEDTDLWIRLAAITAYDCVNEPLAVIVKRPNSVSRNFETMSQGAMTVMRKNRHLLDSKRQGGFWQAAYANVLADYAKWEYRTGHRGQAIMHLLEGLARSPFRRGRMILGLLLAMLSGQKI